MSRFAKATLGAVLVFGPAAAAGCSPAQAPQAAPPPLPVAATAIPAADTAIPAADPVVTQTDPPATLPSPPAEPPPVTEPILTPMSPTMIRPLAAGRSDPARTQAAAAPTLPDDAPAPNLAPEDVIAKVEGSVALIAGRFGSGSGFVVAPGLLATNAHVIAHEHVKDLRVSFPSASGQSAGVLPCDLIYEDTTLDLAILRAACAQPPLTLDAGYRFRRGQSVLVIGNPGTVAEAGGVLLNAVCSGVMSSVVKIHGFDHYQISAMINPGNSGGPVVGMSGRVIGVATSKDSSREGLGFCIAASDVRSALDAVKRVRVGDLRRLNAAHEAGITGAKMLDVTRLYQKCLSDHIDGMALARKAGRREFTTIPWNPARDVAAFAPIDAALNREIYPGLRRSAADPNLDPALKSASNRLWAGLLEVRQVVYKPGATAAEFLDAYRRVSESSRQTILDYESSRRDAGRAVASR